MKTLEELNQNYYVNVSTCHGTKLSDEEVNRAEAAAEAVLEEAKVSAGDAYVDFKNSIERGDNGRGCIWEKVEQAAFDAAFKNWQKPAEDLVVEPAE